MSDQDNHHRSAIIMSGIPKTNSSLYHRIRFSVTDPVVFIQFQNGNEIGQSVLIARDIELDRARRHARVDRVACPADFEPHEGLSGDREIATAQAAAECLRRAAVTDVAGDRSLPLIYAELIRHAGINVTCDRDLGIRDRRSKDEQEIAWLRDAQRVTETAIEMACRMVATADLRSDGVLMVDGQPLTSERVRVAIDQWLLEREYDNAGSIVAGGPQGADCHHIGSGELRTSQPVIIDIFPQCRETRYYGDCTRTVVHGDVPDEVLKMHGVVADAKRRATETVKAGVTGEAVHLATKKAILAGGYYMGLPEEKAPATRCAMVHGTGHGVGLEVHEPPLLDMKGPELVRGDAITIEPGLYCKAIGGVRLEDMVIVTDQGCENLNSLPEKLQWA